MKNYLLFSVFVFFIALSISCDIQEDVPAPEQTKKMVCKVDYYEVNSGDSVLLDPLSNDSIRGEFSFNWHIFNIMGSQHYYANSSFYYLAPHVYGIQYDTLKYSVCTSIKCDTSYVVVKITGKQQQVDSCKPKAMDDIIVYSFPKRQYVQPLLNDTFCDSSVFTIISYPSNGMLIGHLKEGQGIIYSPLLLRRKFNDTLMYTIENNGKKDTARVVFSYQPDCAELFEAQNDTVNFSFKRKKIHLVKDYFLLNDLFCLDDLDPLYFKVISKPQIGNLFFTNNGLLFEHEKDEPFTVEFEYELANRSHTQFKRAKIFIQLHDLDESNSDYLTWLLQR